MQPARVNPDVQGQLGAKLVLSHPLNRCDLSPLYICLAGRAKHSLQTL